ncbi:MAG TPA: transcription elongation factor GreA [Candidatus Limnocylindrales bacterium]
MNGHDLLRTVGLAREGPVLWGHPLAASGPGVFVVELPAPQPKVSIDPAAIREWLDRAPELRLDGQRPTVAELQSRLASFWLPSQVILYIGSSQKSVSARLLGMFKTPLGERRPQSAGYWLKTLRDLPKARIWWSATADPELYEDSLFDEFVKAAGALPFAVLAATSRHRPEHGLTSQLHDEKPAHETPKPTKITLLPDGSEVQPARVGRPRSTTTSARKPSVAAARKAILAKQAQAPSAIEAPKRQPGLRPSMAARNAGQGSFAVIPTHLTPEGLAALQSELEVLKTRRRPEVIARIKAARELGDLSENADYEAARKEQSFLEGRVQQLEQMIKSAVLIASSEGTEVVLGSTVVVETDRHGEETFTIVGSAEADARAGKISFTSPIGRALLGRKPGETVRVQVPAGTLDYRVVEVR